MTLVPTASSGWTITWKLRPDEIPQGNPIPMAFAVNAADLTRGDLSLFVAKMTASLIKSLN